MRKYVHLLAGTAALCLTATGVYAMPMSSGALKPALDATNLVEKSATFIVDGRRYCFYFDGWHGAGWYRCGFAFRRGLGWGGVYGWNSWNYGPYERRMGSRHHGDRIGVDTGSRRINGHVNTRTRSTTGVETRTRSTTGVETRSRSTTGSGVENGARVRGGTTGNKPNADVQSEGAAKVQGSPAGEGAARGGGNMGGNSTGEGGSRRQ